MNNAYSSIKSLIGSSSMLMLSLILMLIAHASYAVDNDQDPSTRVARISYLQGSVSVQLAQSDEWMQARLNRPLTHRDQVFTDAGSRAELQIGMASIHLGENTQLGIMELSDKVLQLQLNQGVLNINVRGMDNDDTVEIDTPNSSITIPEPGNYRIAVSDHDDLTIVQVRDGSAEVAGERQRYSVREHEQLRLSGTGRLNAQFDDLDRVDDFDRWVADRNARARNATAARYVDANMIGYEDLDDYGYWRWEAGFGDVWYPNQVARGWSPYRYGHWEFIGPWGWTWMDDASWGFAPFHYGRWAEVHHRWCWIPGRREVRAVYAPALVAWVGTPGVSISVGVGGGSVGWIPLGPREVFHPHYHASAIYLSRVNLGNSLLNREEFDREIRRRGDRDVFVNRGAASVVDAATFTSAVNVRRNLLPVGPRDLRPMESLERFRPDRSAIVGNARAIAPPVRVIDREVVVQRRPAPFIPRAEIPDRRGTEVGGSVRLIEPVSPRRTFSGDRDAGSPRRQFGSPAQPDAPPNADANPDNRRIDRWGRGSDRLDNLRERDPAPADALRGERRNNPPLDRREVPEPNSNQPRVNPPPQNQQPEPERRRIGPWVRDEQQLRPEPAPPSRQAPPVNPTPAPRIEPPRASPPPPPPQNNAPRDNPNQGSDRPPNNRREIR